MVELIFNFAQFFYSETAIKNKINNTTSDPTKLTKLMHLNYYVLTPLYWMLKALGHILSLTGCFRSAGLVAKLKSSTTGHPDGECADLAATGMTKQQLFDFIRNAAKQGKIEYDQLILEHNADGDCVHIGYRKGACRHQTMVRTIVNGQYVYKNV